MRALPMLLFGAFAGVVSDSVNRKTILQWGMVVSGLASASVCALAWAGVLRQWQVAVAAFAGGRIGFTYIAAVVETVLEALPAAAVHDLATVFGVDREARETAARQIAREAGGRAARVASIAAAD